MNKAKVTNAICSIIAVIVMIYAFMWVWTLYVMSDRRIYNDDFTRGVLRCTVGMCTDGSIAHRVYTNYIAHVDSVEAKMRNNK